MRVVASLSSLMAQAIRCKLKPWTINGFPSITFFGFDAMKRMIVDREQERVFEALTASVVSSSRALPLEPADLVPQ
jgi:hypothetical protein